MKTKLPSGLQIFDIWTLQFAISRASWYYFSNGLLLKLKWYNYIEFIYNRENQPLWSFMSKSARGGWVYIIWLHCSSLQPKGKVYVRWNRPFDYTEPLSECSSFFFHEINNNKKPNFKTIFFKQKIVQESLRSGRLIIYIVFKTEFYVSFFYLWHLLVLKGVLTKYPGYGPVIVWKVLYSFPVLMIQK